VGADSTGAEVEGTGATAWEEVLAGVMGGVERAGTTDAADPGSLILTDSSAASRSESAVGRVRMSSPGVGVGLASD
jgi:hypothetical protein